MPKIPDYFHCIVCDRPLRPCWADEDDRNAPLDNGCLFCFYGAYGTTLFDPAPSEPENRIEIAVCDWCLAGKAKRVRVYMEDGTTGTFADQIKLVRGPGDPEEYDRRTRSYLLAPPRP